MKFLQANRIAPDGTPRSAASHLGLCCLPMSHKRDARLKSVKLYAARRENLSSGVMKNMSFDQIMQLKRYCLK